MLLFLPPFYAQSLKEIRQNSTALIFNLLLLRHKVPLWGNIYCKGRMAEWLGRGLQNLLQRFESASDLKEKIKNINTMAVTRLKRKDRRNKTFSRLEVQFLKIGRNVEIGSRSAESAKSQISKNNAVLDQIVNKAK